MNLRSRGALFIVALIIGASLSAATAEVAKPPNQKTFQSPDRQYEAVVIVADESSEFILEVRDSTGHVLLKKGYTSINRDGGLTLAQAQWTSDSQFFVYSTWHAGGHQAVNSPTFAYSRTANKIFNLEDRLGYIDVSDFTLTPPAIFHTDVLDVKTQVTHKTTLDLSLMITVPQNQQFKTLAEAKLIAELKSDSGRSFALIAGRDCVDCDENTSLYIADLSDQGSLASLSKNRNLYPGVYRDYESGEVVQKVRTFYGKCLATKSDSIVWFVDFSSDKNQWVNAEDAVNLQAGLLAHKMSKTDQPDLSKVLGAAHMGQCHEIPGVDVTTEP